MISTGSGATSAPWHWQAGCRSARQRVVGSGDGDRHPGHRDLQVDEGHREVAEHQRAIDVDRFEVVAPELAVDGGQLGV